MLQLALVSPIKYRKKIRAPIIDVCTGAPPDEVMALAYTFTFFCIKQLLFH